MDVARAVFYMKMFFCGMKAMPAVFAAALFCACSQSSPIVVVSPAKGSVGGVDAGTLYPMIQSVSPGSLQSLDIPKAIQTGVLPCAPGISVVFSQVMANDSGEMNNVFALYDTSGSAASIPVAVYPAASARSFILTPSYPSASGIASGSLKPGTTYELRIYKSAHALNLLPMTTYTGVPVLGKVSRSSNVATIVMPLAHGLVANQLVSIADVTAVGFDAINVPVKVVNTTTFTYANTGSDLGATDDGTGTVGTFNRTLVFHNLVEAPASTISPADPDYVIYSFTTGTDAVADATPPSFFSSSPSDGSEAVDPTSPGGYDSAAGEGYIEFVFTDDGIPMIDPSTVNDLSVTLRNDTDGADVAASSIEGLFADTDFKTFRFYTNALLSSKHYTLQLGTAGYPITDFSGNKALPVTIGFSTQ